MFTLATKTGAPVASEYLYIVDQDTDKVVKATLTDATLTTLSEITVTSITTSVSAPYHDGTDLWICGKADLKVFRLDGFSTTVKNTYDFGANADVNSSNAFVGLYVDTVNQQLYVMNFVNKKVIRTNTGYATTTQSVVSLASLNTPTALTVYNGDMYVADWATKVITRYSGFSSSVVSSVTVSGAVGNLYGIAFDKDGDMYILYQYSGNTSRILKYSGFSNTLLATFDEDTGWGTSPQGIAYARR